MSNCAGTASCVNFEGYEYRDASCVDALTPITNTVRLKPSSKVYYDFATPKFYGDYRNFFDHTAYNDCPLETLAPACKLMDAGCVNDLIG